MIKKQVVEKYKSSGFRLNLETCFISVLQSLVFFSNIASYLKKAMSKFNFTANLEH